MNRSHDRLRGFNETRSDRDQKENDPREDSREPRSRPPSSDSAHGLRGYEHAAGGRPFETPRERVERARHEMSTSGLPSTYGNIPYDPRRRSDELEPWRGRNEEHDFWGQERHPQGQRTQPSLWDRMKGVFTGHGPKNYVRSDERIREDVCEHLADHPYVDASEIEVSVTNGEVTLSGVVDARMVKRAAEDCADQVRGVKDVDNQLRVKSPAAPAR